MGSGRRDGDEGPNPPSIEGVVRVGLRALGLPHRERRQGIVDPADPDQGLRGHQLELEVAARASRLLGESAAFGNLGDDLVRMGLPADTGEEYRHLLVE